MAEPVLALATGERPAAEPFEALYRRAFPRVYAYVASLLRDRSAAEEVTAQAFERAYRKRSTYRQGRGSAEAWLFGIARNAALDELRRLKRRTRLEGDPEDVYGTGPGGHADAGARPRRPPPPGPPAARRCAPRWRRSSRATATSWRSSSTAGSRTPRSAACSA